MQLDGNLELLQACLLIFFRISGVLVFAPIFGNRAIPPQGKVGLALVLTIALLPILPLQTVPLSQSVLGLGLHVIRETLIGIVLGFGSQLVFAGVQLAGELISVQMGFGLATVMDPQFDNQTPTISQLQNIVALFVFLLINGHHWLLQALAKTFEAIPLGGMHYSNELAEVLFKLVSQMFLVTFQVGAPVIIALFLTTVALGLVSRAVPQLNVFTVSFPVKIAIGFAALMLSLQVTASVLQLLFQQMRSDLLQLIYAMG